MSKIRKCPEDHHIWCNFFMRVGPCSMCDRLEEKYPIQEGDTQGDLMKRHFPQNILVGQKE